MPDDDLPTTALLARGGDGGPRRSLRIFGDGIYEVVPVYEKKLFRFEEHMARLGRSLAKLRIDNPLSRE